MPTEGGEFCHETAGGFLRIDGDFRLQQHVAGIHTLIHLNNCHSDLGFALDDRPLNRCCTAVSRQE